MSQRTVKGKLLARSPPDRSLSPPVPGVARRAFRTTNGAERSRGSESQDSSPGVAHRTLSVSVLSGQRGAGCSPATFGPRRASANIEVASGSLGTAPISLEALWLLIVSQWRTLPEALDGAKLGECEVFDEHRVQALVHATLGESRADEATHMLLRELYQPGGSPYASRDRLLSTLGRVPPRQRFRDWANTMLLLFGNLGDLGNILCAGGRPNSRFGPKPTSAWEKTGALPLEHVAFREALILFDVHVNDANMWFEALCKWPQDSLDFGALVRRIIAQPWLDADADITVGVGVGAALSLEDIVVRLIHSWGDLTAAFLLKAPGEKPTTSVPRPAGGAERLSNYSALKYSRDLDSAPPQWTAPSLEQWMRALRGSTSKARLLPESEVRAEAARQVARQREVEATRQSLESLSLQSPSNFINLFPNLSEYICISRANFFPLELVVVRYSRADHGFLGPAILPSSRRANMGAQPFVAIVPLGAEIELIDWESPRTQAIEPQFYAPLVANTKNGTVALRAPCQISSNGSEGLWSVQLFASDDGRRATAPIGSPLPLRVVARPPQVPGRPSLVSCKGSTITMTWSSPVDDGGAPIQANALAVWKADPGWERNKPLRYCAGKDIWPPCNVDGLEPETEYIARVRCETEGGVSLWSEASLLMQTLPPEPGDLGQLQIGEVTRNSATVSWGPHNYKVKAYAVTVYPCDGSDSWTLSVAPPPRSSSPSRRPSITGASPPQSSRPSSPSCPPSNRRNSLTGGTPKGGTPKGDSLSRGSMTPLPNMQQHIADKVSGSWTKVVVDGLDANTLYEFTIQAINSSGGGRESEKSEVIKTGPGMPNAPGAPRQTEATETSITLEWDLPNSDGGAEVVRYFVRGVKDGGEGDVTPSPLEVHTKDASCSVVLRRLQGNTRYVFRVYALNSSGLSLPSAASEPMYTGAVGPKAPTSLSVHEATDTSLMLRWKAPAENGGAPVQQYRVVVVMQGSSEEHFAFSTPSLGVIVTGLQGNSYYVVRVSAENASGNSVNSELIALTGPVATGAPGAPRCLDEPMASMATLAWSRPTNDGGTEILGYTVRGHALGDGSGAAVAAPDVLCDLDSASPRALVEGLVPSQRYRFRVVARNAAGTSVPSEWSLVIRTAPPPPATPSQPIVLSATSQTINVSWEAPDLDNSFLDEDLDPMEFEVKMSRVSDDSGSAPDDSLHSSVGGPRRVQRVFAPPAQFKGLRMFAAHTFSVRARGRGGWSEWSVPSEPQQTTSEWSKEEIVDFLMQRHGNTLGGIFRTFDRDCDGFLSSDEFIAGLDRSGLQSVSFEMKMELYNEADEGDRGCITLREFTKCLGRAAAEAAKAAASKCQANRRAEQAESEAQAGVREARSLSPGCGRSRGTATISRPWRQNASSLSPPRRSLSPQALTSSLRRMRAEVRGGPEGEAATRPLRRACSARVLHKAASTKVLAPFQIGAQTCDTPPELRSGTGECATPPAGDSESMLPSSIGEPPIARRPGTGDGSSGSGVRRGSSGSGSGRPWGAAVPRGKTAAGPIKKSMSQQVLLPR